MGKKKYQAGSIKSFGNYLQNISLNIPSRTNPQADSRNTGLPRKGKLGWTDYIAEIKGGDNEEALGSEKVGGML